MIRALFNATFFAAMDRYIDRRLRSHKRRIFADLPDRVLEIGSGVGANLRYLRPGTQLIAVEPNRYMHRRLRANAARRDVTLQLRGVPAEQLDQPEASVPVVISSLVLCSVPDPAATLAWVHRVLEPGGRFAFAEHVAAPDRCATRRVQRAVRRPWAWLFDGCSCERDLATAIELPGLPTSTSSAIECAARSSRSIPIFRESQQRRHEPTVTGGRQLLQVWGRSRSPKGSASAAARAATVAVRPA